MFRNWLGIRLAHGLRLPLGRFQKPLNPGSRKKRAATSRNRSAVKQALPRTIITNCGDDSIQRERWNIVKTVYMTRTASKITLMARNPFKIWPILRDAIILTVLTGLGGFIVGFASTDHSSRFYFYGLALSNTLFCIIGFAISGCLAVGNRWRHLAFVAVIAWIVSVFNVIFFNLPIVMWMASVVPMAFFALIGGGISFIFKGQSSISEPSSASLPPTLNKPATSEPAKSKAGVIVAVLVVLIIVIVIIANSGSDSTSATNSSPSGNQGQAGGTAPGYTPPPVNTPPLCKALDEKNGFKDFKLGMTPEEVCAILPPTDTNVQAGAGVTNFVYQGTSADQIGSFSVDLLSLSFFDGHLYRIDLIFSNFQNEILDAFKVNFGEPFNTSDWNRGDQPLLGKAWQGNKVSAVILSVPGQLWDSAVIYDIAANQKAADYAAKEPERAAEDFGTNGFKTLVMGMKIQDVSLDYTVVNDDQISGVKKVVFSKGDYWNYWQNIGYYPLDSVSAEFFHDQLYRIDFTFSQNQKGIFETFKQRFGPLQDNDTWTRDSVKLRAKSGGDSKLSATILAPEGSDGDNASWDSMVLMDVGLWNKAEQFKNDAPARAAKDF